jgi:hypothetical protein
LLRVPPEQVSLLSKPNQQAAEARSEDPRPIKQSFRLLALIVLLSNGDLDRDETDYRYNCKIEASVGLEWFAFFRNNYIFVYTVYAVLS